MNALHGALPLIAAAALAAAACGGTASQVPVVGDASTIDMLAGDWTGDYIGVDSGRQGTIRFSLTVGRHTADGEVVMHPVAEGAAPRPLRIQFVEVAEGGEISGTIAPYHDPQCDCMVKTQFTGRVSGDVMEGRFETRAVDKQQVQAGRWSVTRTET